MILTLGFDAAGFGRLEPLRQAHFPPERNFIPVHVTLFQQLPGEHLDRIHAALSREAASVPPLPYRATGIVDFPTGAAIAIDCPPARALQSRLRRRWSDILTKSDDRGRDLHVTIQNKVDRDAARETQAHLRAGFTPWDGVIAALLLWHYRGGPWEAAGEFPLAGAAG